jgi:H+/Cl- antiporter ClcA
MGEHSSADNAYRDRPPGPDDDPGRHGRFARYALKLLLGFRHWRRRLVFWGGALATGVIVVLFARLSDLGFRSFQAVQQDFPLWRWVGPPLGFMLVAWLTRRVFPGAQGSGIPQTIAALEAHSTATRRSLLSLRIAFGKIALTSIGLAVGGSVGREGPSVQVGASIMYSVRRLAKFQSAALDRGLILAGASAGVAAAFNTPLAGIVFAIEELSRSFEERTSGTILTAVILAGIASIALAGNYTYFGSIPAVMTSTSLWAAVPVCGIVGGVCGGAFARLLLAIQGALPAPIAAFRARSPIIFAGLCGIGVAVVGWMALGTTFGTGYAEARALVQQQGMPPVGFAGFKAVATLLSYASGVPAGLFSPSLAVGAGIGGELSRVLSNVPGSAIVVFTMAAYFAAVVQAPLTALVIVTEMTNSQQLTIPLMAAVFLGRAVGGVVCRHSLYRTLAVSFRAARSDAKT